MERYPPARQIAAPSALRAADERARAEIANYKAAANAANVTARDLAKDKNKYKSEATIARRQLLQISKRQKASDEAKKAGFWSGLPPSESPFCMSLGKWWGSLAGIDGWIGGTTRPSTGSWCGALQWCWG